ncbi:MAG: hypothetical protein Q9217_001560 [Psora testacea]
MALSPPTTLRSGPSWTSIHSPTTRDELRLHSCYIRDSFAAMLANSESNLPASEVEFLEAIFARVATITMTLDYLRYSRMEKALMLLATADERTFWPPGSVADARKLLQKWERELGPLENIRADLFADGGRLEGTFRATYWTNTIVVHDEVSPSLPA